MLSGFLGFLVGFLAFGWLFHPDTHYVTRPRDSKDQCDPEWRLPYHHDRNLFDHVESDRSHVRWFAWLVAIVPGYESHSKYD